MSEEPSLKGKRILVPRGKNEARSFSKLVEDNGGVPVEIPLIAFKAIPPSIEIETMIQHLDTYDWIIFTSNVTVETFLSLNESHTFSLPKIAVIGKRTAVVLESKGFKVDFIPDEFVAEGFVRDFLPLVLKGMKVLIPKGNLARDYIAEAITKAGALVEEIIIYETYLPEESKIYLKEMILSNQLDVLTFTSPSTVDHFVQVIEEFQLKKEINNCLIACIGPVTKQKLDSVGLIVDIMPETYTVEEMLKSVMLSL
ncbi:uroporphyrinogen-III synthase [Neobacillus sp. D3-1R]|uniref:uroporphyrinogen-III synthase n=1 Tax=Neobacillus sp. D3-1R TaxID=3445778 RepID=UPI003F9F7C17